MKYNMDELRNALPGEPESCRAALMQTARSVKEEEPVKKFTFRTALIAALIVVSMVAAAFAATNSGLMNWIQNDYGVVLPQSAQDVLNAAEKATMDTELVTFHVNETMCDGKIAYLTVEAQLKDGQNAILYPNCWEPDMTIGEVLAQKLNHQEVTAESTYLDAAKATGLPLYGLDAYLEVNGDIAVNNEMMDAVLTENGNWLLIDMLYFADAQNAETLPVNIVARATELNAETYEFVESSRQKADAAYTIPVHGVTAEHSYAPEEPAKLSDCFTLTQVDAKQTCAGVYVTLKTKADAPLSLDEFYGMMGENLNWNVLDAQGNQYPMGLSLTGEYLDGNGQTIDDDTTLDEVQYMLMISIEQLPESMIVTDGTAQIVVK